MKTLRTFGLLVILVIVVLSLSGCGANSNRVGQDGYIPGTEKTFWIDSAETEPKWYHTAENPLWRQINCESTCNKVRSIKEGGCFQTANGGWYKLEEIGKYLAVFENLTSDNLDYFEFLGKYGEECRIVYNSPLSCS